MACCKCCCGGENCTEGQQGKCCCGGPSGTCCQSGEYCCSGACQSSPCMDLGWAMCVTGGPLVGQCLDSTQYTMDEANEMIRDEDGVLNATIYPGLTCADYPCGVCCVSCSPDTSYTTKSACEQCDQTFYCYEEIYQEDPEAPCPEGYFGGGGYCYRYGQVASCAACGGWCDPYTTGPCGTWKEAPAGEHACNPGWCLSLCSLSEDTEYSRTDTQAPVPPYREGEFVVLVKGSNGLLSAPFPSWGLNSSNYSPAGECVARIFNETYANRTLSYYPLGSSTSYTITRSRTRRFVYEPDCESKTLTDVTSTAITDPAVRSTDSGCNFIWYAGGFFGGYVTRPCTEDEEALITDPGEPPTPVLSLVCPP